MNGAFYVNVLEPLPEQLSRYKEAQTYVQKLHKSGSDCSVCRKPLSPDLRRTVCYFKTGESGDPPPVEIILLHVECIIPSWPAGQIKTSSIISLFDHPDVHKWMLK